MKQEENSHKNEFNRHSKGQNEGKNINQLKNWTYNVYVPRSKFSSLNYIWKTHGSNKVSCHYYITWSNITSFFCSIFFVIFPIAVSYFNPATVRLIHIHGMTMVGIIRRLEKDLWQIIRGGKSTNIVFGGNRYGSWKHIRGTPGSFLWYGSIINSNGRQIQIWATTTIWKGIIEAVIERIVSL